MSRVFHLAGEPVDNVQRCERCGLVLVDYAPGEPRPMFFPAARLVKVDGALFASVPDPDAEEVRGSLCILATVRRAASAAVLVLLLLAGPAWAAAVDHWEAGVFRCAAPAACASSTDPAAVNPPVSPFSVTVFTRDFVKCGLPVAFSANAAYASPVDGPADNVPNPTVLAFTDPDDSTKECRLNATQAVLTLPIGVSYRLAMRAVDAAGNKSGWSTLSNTFRRAPRGFPCPNGQPGVLFAGENDINGQPVHLTICVSQ